MSTPDNPLQLPAHIKAMPEEEKRLRKEWLKRKFASFEYHEELVRLHEQWRNVLRKALQRAVHDQTPDPDCGTKGQAARNFERTYWPIIERKPKPGDYKPELWDKYYATGMFRSIPDYSRYLLSEGDMLDWMTEDEHTELTKYWTPMARMAQNIAYTVDERWEEDPDDADWILDEEYTGPIDWPDDWRAEVSPPRIKAGEPVPQGGVWQSVDDHKRQLRVQAGERLPDLGSAYGITLWERIGD